nr:beta-lactamase family protein [candidate division Zixibacteria bacterium]
MLLVLIFSASCREIQNELDHYLVAANELWGFEGTALVAVRGRIILCKGYGLANKEMGIPNTPQTRFYMGSITKQFTAAAILKLQEQGLLDINDPITKYLPEYPRPSGDKVKLRHLLSHSSGIPNYTDDPRIVLKRTMRMTPEELIRSFQYKALEFEPGTEFRYSNSNYIILGVIIERVSGQSYEAYLHHNILHLAGMKNTGYARREAGIPDRADGYTQEEPGQLVDAVPVDHSILYSAGALYSTVEDIFLWDRALYGNSILSRQSVEAMMTPNLGNYGFGWMLENKYGRRHAYHGGFLDGFNSIYSRWPDDHLCIVVFSNDDEAPVKKMAMGLAAIVFGKPYVKPIRKTPRVIDPRRLHEYAGAYQVDSGLYRYVIVDNDSLYTNLRLEPRQLLYPQAVDTFFFASDNTRLMAFGKDDSGRVDELGVIDEGIIYPAKKMLIDSLGMGELPVIPTVLPYEELVQLTGIYWLESYTDENNIKFTLVIAQKEGKLFASIGRSEPIELTALSENEFIYPASEFRITFIINGDGNAPGCIIEMGDAEIRGEKIR